ncbi:hypothetical protein [Bacillus benzoevorans]|uniref:Uncharacterized protein n=1 Tax=Bacillus benzoevorans TaxID=1456 RepID=A0A7X0HTC0_9BACI|nr:hypothetical protein [Bacillus benzoevorans]
MVVIGYASAIVERKQLSLTVSLNQVTPGVVVVCVMMRTQNTVIAKELAIRLNIARGVT